MNKQVPPELEEAIKQTSSSIDDLITRVGFLGLTIYCGLYWPFAICLMLSLLINWAIRKWATNGL